MGRTKHPPEAYLWTLFSGGGMLAALLLPALFFVLFLAEPLGLVTAASHSAARDLVTRSVTRVLLFGLVTLSLFHWAHRFRYTLYDGLQLYHLNTVIAVLTYGTAALLSLGAAVLFVGIG